jgi:hypothetical protein
VVEKRIMIEGVEEGANWLKLKTQVNLIFVPSRSAVIVSPLTRQLTPTPLIRPPGAETFRGSSL